MPRLGLLLVLALVVVALIGGAAMRLGAEIALKRKQQPVLTNEGATKDPKRQEIPPPDTSQPARVILPSPFEKDSN